MREKKVILLMGPTGAGKTDAAIGLSSCFPIEIVSVDSALVYRGMDIGTAKPTAALQAQVPHHLIDILDPAERYSVGQFLRDASKCIDEIHSRGNTPVLTGGTMLYFHAALNGLAELPDGDPQLRREIDSRASREGWTVLHAELARLDPQAAARIHPNDAQRIQRALEVCRLSGAPLSRLQAERRPILGNYSVSRIVLCPAERSVLHERIARRFHDMMARGFLEEVATLHARHDLNVDLPSMRAVGYRQLWEHLDGRCGLEEAVERSIAATRQLAKRQLTWLRAVKGASWCDNPVAEQIATLC